MENNMGKLQINEDLVREKFTDISQALFLLKNYAGIEKTKLLNDSTLLSAVKYQLIIALEAAQNICNHLAARLTRRSPASYADCFRILGEENIITEDLSIILASMAKFRNLLVHQYGKIDDNIVYSILKNSLTDLEKYMQEVSAFLASTARTEHKINEHGKV